MFKYFRAHIIYIWVFFFFYIFIYYIYFLNFLRYIPPLPPVETWEDLIIKEEIRNKNEDEKRDIDDYKLTHESREKVLDIMRQTRLINHCNYEIQKNKQKNILYFVTPKMG